MKVLRVCAVVFTRFILSAVFFTSAMENLFHWQETEHILLATLSDWQNYMSFSEGLSAFFGSLTSWTSVLLLIGTLFQLGGALLVLLGIRERMGAVLILLILVPSTIVFHQFWFIDGGARELQSSLFLKNLAIMGGLMMVVLYGAQSGPDETEMNPF